MEQITRVDSPEESINQLKDSIFSNLRVAMPAIVVSADLDRQVVSVRPAVRGLMREQGGEVKEQEFPILTEVPIVYPRAGGFALTYPIKAGDECLVVFSDCCIDFWWQSGGTQSPHDRRKHDLSDAIAIFGPTSQAKKLSDVQDDAIELRTESRNNFVSLKDGELNINITGKANVNIAESAVVTIGSSATVNCPVCNWNGIVNFTGSTATMSAEITMNGNLTVNGDVTISGISVLGHYHQGDSGGTTSEPKG